MSLDESHIQSLRRLIEQFPALLDQLKQSKSIDESAKVLAEAAQQEGLSIDEEDLRAYFAQAVKQPKSSGLSDAQLDAVAGGLSDAEVLCISIFTFSIGCQVLAIDYLVKNG
jgi:Arc/MetJ family transcription regulator